MIKRKFLIAIVLLLACNIGEAQTYKEPFRPQIHFSPKAHWMNDPNGMVYYKGIYHLFFQYYPDGTVWGPMHWGHATSNDLVHWKEKPIALYPDSLGYIFSGSAVADINNTSGLGKKGEIPLVAIYTNHDPVGEKAGRNNYQTQSIAYSLDNGATWTKYAGNPVLKNPGITDFRDPKVSWYEEGKKWIMTLATKDRITFFSSRDLKNWKKESEFGESAGAHGGVWECPDLFSMDYKGEKISILLVNINPGGPNGGSATQYFTGKFNGETFIPFETDTRWLDYGPDEYAGVTWSNTGKRKIFLGWMSNWDYATVVPTQNWRSAMTVPRELGISKIGNKFMLTSMPVSELNILNKKIIDKKDLDVTEYDLTEKTGKLTGPARLHISAGKIENFSIIFSNESGEKVEIGFDKATNSYFIDRSNSGKVDFAKKFAERHTAPRLSNKNEMDLELILDNASVELFADNGLSVMTEIFFPNKIYSKIQIQSPDHFQIQSLQLTALKSIWE
jgi:fructan beta-fructosidase